jgi:hypothetical protein
MTMLGKAALALVLWNPVADAADQVVKIADFTHGTDGFDGALVAKSTSGFAVLANPGPGRWAESGKDFAVLCHDFTALRFRARTTSASFVAVRLIDATGQALQYAVDLKKGGWNTYELTDFSRPKQSWGGAQDGLWHPPARRMQFILDGIGKDLDLDDIEVVLAPQPVPGFEEKALAAQRARTVTLATFTRDLEGFIGSFQRVGIDARSGPACAMLVNGDKWVEAVRELPADMSDLLTCSLWVRTTEAKRIGIRFTDATGQAFMHRPLVVNDGSWHEVVIANPAAAVETWGGAKDAVWHGPCRSIAIVNEFKNATVWVDDISVLAAPAKTP